MVSKILGATGRNLTDPHERSVTPIQRKMCSGLPSLLTIKPKILINRYLHYSGSSSMPFCLKCLFSDKKQKTKKHSGGKFLFLQYTVLFFLKPLSPTFLFNFRALCIYPHYGNIKKVMKSFNSVCSIPSA